MDRAIVSRRRRKLWWREYLDGLIDPIIGKNRQWWAFGESAPVWGWGNMMMQKKVLVVDDIPVNQKVLLMHLNKVGVSADVANSGDEAVAACMDNHYAVIFMDLDMPGMDGFEATRHIRELDQMTGAHTPILAVSSFDRPEDKQKCIRAGMDGFLHKGLNGEQLLSVIKQFAKPEKAKPHIDVAPPVEPKKDVLAGLAKVKSNFDDSSLELLSDLVSCARSLDSRFQKAIDKRDVPDLTVAAYAIKGVCSNLGFTEMAALCTDIAAQGDAGNWAEVSQMYRQLTAMVKSVESHIAVTSTAK
jgi:two-component system, sensor histidine kinase and response regulator